MIKRRAFTFLELMLALVIVSVVAGAVALSLKAAFTAKDSIVNALEPNRQANAAIEFIRRDLESSLVPNSVIAYQFVGYPINDGNYPSHDLIFPASVDPMRNPNIIKTDVRQVEYTMLPEGNDHVLWRKVASNLLPVDGTSFPTDDEIICRGVRSFSIAYYDGTQNADPNSWLDSWDSTQTTTSLGGTSQNNLLPYAVQVTLQLEPVKAGGQPTTITRVIQLPCAVPASQPATTSTTGTTP